jgi:hypothetical protein
MNDETGFPESIREEARKLQYQGGVAMEARIRAGVAAGIVQPNVFDLLARWFVPVAAAAAAVLLASTLTLYSAADQAVDPGSEAGMMVMAEEVFGVE